MMTPGRGLALMLVAVCVLGELSRIFVERVLGLAMYRHLLNTLLSMGITVILSLPFYWWLRKSWPYPPPPPPT
jgi:hypothetical protein